MPQSTHVPPESPETVDIGGVSAKKVLLWDRKEKGGFPGEFYRSLLFCVCGMLGQNAFT
jgi:predicted Rdx family selenoprotein